MQLSKSEQLMYSTLPIKTLNTSGYSTGTATGFMADFYDGDDPHLYCPALVTNRHVLDGCEKLQVKFTHSLNDGSPDVGNIIPVILDASDKILHPDPNIDLGVIPLLPTINRLTGQGLQPFCVWPHVKSLTPAKAQWDDFTAIEPVIMLGYPKGLMDAKYNHPIIRQGITATHPSFDYNGAPVFVKRKM